MKFARARHPVNVLDHATPKADAWIKDLMRELGTDDPHQAYRALSGSLQALLDRPVWWRPRGSRPSSLCSCTACSTTAFTPAATPLHLRHSEELLALVDRKAGDGHGIDPERALAATLETRPPARVERCAPIQPIASSRGRRSLETRIRAEFLRRGGRVAEPSRFPSRGLATQPGQ